MDLLIQEKEIIIKLIGNKVEIKSNIEDAFQLIAVLSLIINQTAVKIIEQNRLLIQPKPQEENKNGED